MRKTLRLAGIEFTKVDGLGDIGIRFPPILADLVDQPGHQFKLAFAQPGGGAEQQADPFFPRGSAPTAEGTECRIDDWFDLFFTCHLVDTHDLRRTSRIQRGDFLRGTNSMPADDEVVFSPQLASNFIQRPTHASGNVASGEVSCRLVAEWRYLNAGERARRSFYGCHDWTSG